MPEHPVPLKAVLRGASYGSALLRDRLKDMLCAVPEIEITSDAGNVSKATNAARKIKGHMRKIAVSLTKGGVGTHNASKEKGK